VRLVRLTVREMQLDEVETVIRYFHESPVEHLEMMGVDPTKLPDPAIWLARYSDDYKRPVEDRKTFLVIWLSDDTVVGFSTADRIVYGQEAYMHLHVLSPDQRNRGIGAACVRGSARIYFDILKLERLYCQPNAFNVAPHRTLQRAGFKYLKTFKTVPGPLNYRQAVTRWVLEKRQIHRQRW
jgi:RimJ/RimL family protein N-acetyltransferase